MEAWVIKRDDGKYYVTTRKCGHRRKHIYDNRLLYALKESCKSEAQETIDNYNLQNCKPVKIKICEVEEDE